MMKTLLLMSAGVMLSAGLFAQQKQVGDATAAPVPNFKLNFDGDRAIDTIAAPATQSACGVATAAVVYSSTNGGYVCGTNGYQDFEKGQAWPTVTGDVTGMLVFYGEKKETSGNTMYTAKIYNFDNTTLVTGAALGTSTAVPYSAIDTTGNFTTFTFATPVTVSNTAGFVSTVTVDGADTVGIVSTQDPCGPSFSLEQWNDNSWHTFADPNNWDLEIDMIMYVMIDNLTINSTGDNPDSKINIFYANDHLNIEGIAGAFTINSISIVDMNGKIVRSESNVNVESTTYAYPLADIANGNYIVQMKTNHGPIAVKFNVTK